MQRGTYTVLVALLALVLFIGIINLDEVNINFERNLLIIKASDLKATIMQLQLSFDKALTNALAKAVEKKYQEDGNCILPRDTDYHIESLFSDIVNEINRKENLLCSYKIENNFQNGSPFKITINCTFTALKQNKLWFNINSNNKFELRKKVVHKKIADGCEIRIVDLHTMVEELHVVIR